MISVFGYAEAGHRVLFHAVFRKVDYPSPYLHTATTITASETLTVFAFPDLGSGLPHATERANTLGTSL